MRSAEVTGSRIIKNVFRLLLRLLDVTFLGLLFSGYFEEESAANTALEFDPKGSMTCFDSH